MPSFLRAPLVALLLAALAVAGARSLSTRLLFPVSEVAARAAPRDIAALEARADDGAPVRMLWLAPPAGGPVAVVFHNNRETAEQGAPLARGLRARGVGALLVEYRGYGASRGAGPSEEGLYADADGALAWLAARGTPPSRTVLVGRSLGTGVAAEMARRGRGEALVLVSPYTSIDRLVTDVVAFAPARLFVRDRFDTLSKAGDIHVPTLIVHGDADAIVPFAMGATLARAIPRASLWPVAGATHADVVARAGDRLIDAIAALARGPQ